MDGQTDIWTRQTKLKFSQFMSIQFQPIVTLKRSKMHQSIVLFDIMSYKKRLNKLLTQCIYINSQLDE